MKRRCKWCGKEVPRIKTSDGRMVQPKYCQDNNTCAQRYRSHGMPEHRVRRSRRCKWCGEHIERIADTKGRRVGRIPNFCRPPKGRGPSACYQAYHRYGMRSNAQVESNPNICVICGDAVPLQVHTVGFNPGICGKGCRLEAVARNGAAWRESLADGYIKQLLPKELHTPEMVAFKRQHIRLLRAIANGDDTKTLQRGASRR